MEPSPIQIRTVGRAEHAIPFTIGEPLTLDSLGLLEKEKGIKPPLVKTLRDSHHALARVLSTGASYTEASLATGYSISRISILMADPAFQELMAMYRAEVREAFSDLTAKMKMVASSSVDEIIERLEVEPEKFTLNQLMELTKTMADRAGFGPQSKSTNVNVNVDLAGRLEQARRRAAIGTVPGEAVLIEGRKVLDEESGA